MTIEELLRGFLSDRWFIEETTTHRIDKGATERHWSYTKWGVWVDYGGDDGPSPRHVAKLTVKDGLVVRVEPATDSWHDLRLVLKAARASLDGDGNVLLGVVAGKEDA